MVAFVVGASMGLAWWTFIAVYVSKQSKSFQRGFFSVFGIKFKCKD